MGPNTRATNPPETANSWRRFGPFAETVARREQGNPEQGPEVVNRLTEFKRHSFALQGNTDQDG
jgi:hypothetical protein